MEEEPIFPLDCNLKVGTILVFVMTQLLVNRKHPPLPLAAFIKIYSDKGFASTDQITLTNFTSLGEFS